MSIRKIRWLVRAFIHRHRVISSVLALILIVILVAGRVIFSPNFLTSLSSTFSENSYTEGIVGAPQTLNPLLATSDSEIDLSSLLFRSLTKTDLAGNTTGDLAESWEVNPLGQLYLFHLKPNQKFVTGDPITANDVAYTYQLIQSGKYNTRYSGTLSNVDIEVLDQNTILFKLKEPFSAFLSLTDIGILPKNQTDRQLGRGVDFTRLNIVSLTSTDYKLASFSEDGAILTKGNQTFTFRFYKTSDDLTTALKLGEVKAGGFDIPVNFTEWKKFQVLSSPLYQRFAAVFYNTRQAPFNDKTLRQGLSYAIDKEQIVSDGLNGSGVVAYSSVAPVSWAKSPTLKKYDYNTAQAATELDKSGWVVKGDFRSKDNQSLNITLSYQNIDPFPEVAKIIAQNWSQVGVKVTLDPLTPQAFDDKVVKKKKFQTALFVQGVGIDPDQYVLWHTTRASDSNITGISAPKLDKALEDGRRTVDRNDRITKYLDFQRFLLDESPVSFLYYPKYSFVVSDRIQGIDLKPLGLPKDRYSDFSTWKVAGSLF